MRRSLIVAFGALALFASSLAHAAEPDTIVTLKNGDVARGVLVERVTGDHVTIQLSTGESRTYPWNDVESVKPLSAAPPPASTQAPASPPAPSGAVVHIESNDEDASLSRLAGRGEGSWAGGGGYGSMSLELVDVICSPPCGKVVPAGRYRMSGRSLIDSKDFDVPSSGEITIHANMSGRGRRVGGMIGLFTGIPFIIGGATMFVLAASMGAPTASSVTGYTSPDPRPTFFIMGGIMLGVGVVGTVLGAYFLATAHSDVTITPGNTLQSFVARGGTLTF